MKKRDEKFKKLKRGTTAIGYLDYQKDNIEEEIDFDSDTIREKTTNLIIWILIGALLSIYAMVANFLFLVPPILSICAIGLPIQCLKIHSIEKKLNASRFEKIYVAKQSRELKNEVTKTREYTEGELKTEEVFVNNDKERLEKIKKLMNLVYLCGLKEGKLKEKYIDQLAKKNNVSPEEIKESMSTVGLVLKK